MRKIIITIIVMVSCVSGQTPTPTQTPGVNINPASATLYVGETLQAVVTNEVGQPFASSWTLIYLPLPRPAPQTCVEVSASGLVTARTVGKCGVSVLAYQPVRGMVPATPISVTVISPVMFVQDGRAIALDGQNLTREPFPLVSPDYFGPDKRTRLVLFFTNMEIDGAHPITIRMTDSAGIEFALAVQYNFQWPNATPPVWQVGIALPGNAATGDAIVCAMWKNLTTNCAPILIGP